MATLGQNDEAGAPLRYVVALVAEGFLEAPISTDRWIAHPLRAQDPLYGTALASWMDAVGANRTDGNDLSLPVVDMVSITSRCHADSLEDALRIASDELSQVMLAVWVRQMDGGRVLAVIAADSQSPAAITRHDFKLPVQAYHRIEGDGTFDPGRQVLSLASVIGDSPTGQLLAELFVEANRDRTLHGSHARLWSVLEVLAGRFSDSTKLPRVRAMLTHLGLAGDVDLVKAYRARNDFVHEGKRWDEADLGPVRLRLGAVVFLALVRSGFAVVDPRSQPFVEPANAPQYVMELRPPQGPTAAANEAPSQPPADQS